MKGKQWKKTDHIDVNQKKARVLILISDKVYFRAWTSRSIHKGDIAVLNVYVPNNIGITYVKQTLIELKGEIDKSTNILGDFNTSLLTIDKTARQKISKHLELNRLSTKIV